MSLMELMVSLAVLSLVAGLVFSNIGPQLGAARASSNEAAFWRTLAPTQMLLTELSAGAVDPGAARITSDTVTLRTLAPRLSPTPIQITLRIDTGSDRASLFFNAPELGPDASLVLDAPGALRFVQQDRGALVLEWRRSASSAWTPLAAGRFLADAPFVCAFDPIPRSCR